MKIFDHSNLKSVKHEIQKILIPGSEFQVNTSGWSSLEWIRPYSLFTKRFGKERIGYHFPQAYQAALNPFYACSPLLHYSHTPCRPKIILKPFLIGKYVLTRLNLHKPLVLLWGEYRRRYK